MIYTEGISMRKEYHAEDNGQIWIRCHDDRIGVGHTIRVMDALFPLIEAEGWRSFDPIRNDPRFAAYVERVKAVFQPDTTNE